LPAGNLACDAVQGGRLIYYDFGMMDEFQPGVKKGLVSFLRTFYSFSVEKQRPRMIIQLSIYLHHI
jgi:predicted unusual protein kinase regulating ubiquinone biosynthesis (AarF/ABC1/UbiB family)